jgi:hypothetical protein
MVFKKMKNGKVVHSINPIAHILNASKQEQIIEKKTEGGIVNDLETKLKNINLSSSGNTQEQRTNTKLDRFINFKL